MKDNLDLITTAITILIIGLFYCIISNKNNGIIENMSCVFDKKTEERLRNSFLWDQEYEDNYDYRFSKNKKLTLKDINKLKNILKRRSTFSNDNKKIKDIFDEPKKVVFYIEEMIDFLLIDDSKEYKEKIDENTTINLIIHLLLILRLRRIFNCKNLQKLGDDNPIISNKIASLLSKNIVRLCTEEDLKSFCESFKPSFKVKELDKELVLKEMEAFTNNQYLEDDTREVVDHYEDYDRSFGVFSIKDSIDNFGVGYYNDTILDNLLKVILKKFEDQYKLKYDKYDLEHLSELCVIFLKDIHKVLDELHKVDDSNLVKKYELQIKYNPMRELFYNLKFHYKILSIYYLINKTITNEKDRIQAYKCCGNGNGQCFNFTKNRKDETPVVFGTNEYGFRKDSKCHPSSMAHVKKRQNTLLKTIMDEEEIIWKKLDDNTKNLYIEYLDDIVNYVSNNLPSIDDKSKPKTLIYFMEKLKKMDKLKIETIFISELRSNLIPITLNVNNFITDETKNVILLIEESKSYNKIIRLINDINPGEGLNKNFDFVSLENLTLIKFSVIKLLEINSLFIHLNANKNLSMMFLKMILNLVDTDLNYFAILKKVGILPRNIGFFLEKFSEILKDNKYIKISKNPIMFSSKPKESITYNTNEIKKVVGNENTNLKNIFPAKEEDVCEVFKPILYILRSQKKITPEEYIKYKNLIGDECFKRYEIFDPNEKKIQPFTSVEDDYNKMIDTINNYIRKHPN
tara:strand:- start:2020 stop:4245 length:2226 start_codon:yes stop_codon:yes gene_type:complete